MDIDSEPAAGAQVQTVAGLPVSVWSRIFVHYLDTVNEHTATASKISGALVPLLISRRLLRVAVEALYAGPTVPPACLNAFHRAMARDADVLAAAAADADEHEPVPVAHRRAALVRSLRVSPVLLGDFDDRTTSPKSLKRWGHGLVHRCLPRLLAKLDLENLWLPVVLMNGSDAHVLLAALERARVRGKLRLELGMAPGWQCDYDVLCPADQQTYLLANREGAIEKQEVQLDQLERQLRVHRSIVTDALRSFTAAISGRITATPPPLPPARTAEQVEAFRQAHAGGTYAEWAKACIADERVRRQGFGRFLREVSQGRKAMLAVAMGRLELDPKLQRKHERERRAQKRMDRDLAQARDDWDRLSDISDHLDSEDEEKDTEPLPEHTVQFPTNLTIPEFHPPAVDIDPLAMSRREYMVAAELLLARWREEGALSQNWKAEKQNWRKQAKEDGLKYLRTEFAIPPLIPWIPWQNAEPPTTDLPESETADWDLSAAELVDKYLDPEDRAAAHKMCAIKFQQSMEKARKAEKRRRGSEWKKRSWFGTTPKMNAEDKAKRMNEADIVTAVDNYFSHSARISWLRNTNSASRDEMDLRDSLELDEVVGELYAPEVEAIFEQTRMDIAAERDREAANSTFQSPPTEHSSEYVTLQRSVMDPAIHIASTYEVVVPLKDFDKWTASEVGLTQPYPIVTYKPKPKAKEWALPDNWPARADVEGDAARVKAFFRRTLQGQDVDMDELDHNPDVPESDAANDHSPAHGDIRITLDNLGIPQRTAPGVQLPPENSTPRLRPITSGGAAIEPECWLGSLIPVIPRGTLLPLLYHDMGVLLASILAPYLADALSTCGARAISLVAEDPVAVRILTGELWERLDAPHVRVRLPVTAHPLGVFRQSANESVVLRKVDPRDYVDSDTSFGINVKVHPNTNMFELETDRAYNDDPRWLDPKIPYQVYRVNADEADWARVVPGIGEVVAVAAAELDDEDDVPLSVHSSAFASPTFSFASDASFVDVDSDELDDTLSGGEGEGFDAAAAEEQERRIAQRKRAREEMEMDE